MKPLPIVAVSSFAQVAPEQPDSLRERVKEVCARAPRRVNRIIELGLLGAHRCVSGRELPGDTAIYMAFTSGCIADSVSLVQDVVRGQMPMPVTFINVSSNMAGFYIASSLGLHSGNQVVSCNDFAWEATLELAMLGTANGRGMLLGVVEEAAWPLDEHRKRLSLSPGTDILETSHWLLADRAASSPIASVQWVRRFSNDATLFEFLGQQSWPRDTQLQMQNGGAAEAFVKKLGLKHMELEHAGHTGLPAARAAVQFVQEKQGGALLQLSRGRGGAWYAVLLTAE